MSPVKLQNTNVSCSVFEPSTSHPVQIISNKLSGDLTG